MQGSDKTKLEVYDSVRARLNVKNSYKIRPEVHSSATARASDKTKLEVHGSVRAQLKVKKIDTKLGKGCIAVPLQVQDSDPSKLNVHGSVRAQLVVINSYKFR